MRTNLVKIYFFPKTKISYKFWSLNLVQYLHKTFQKRIKVSVVKFLDSKTADLDFIVLEPISAFAILTKPSLFFFTWIGRFFHFKCWFLETYTTVRCTGNENLEFFFWRIALVLISTIFKGRIPFSWASYNNFWQL